MVVVPVETVKNRYFCQFLKRNLQMGDVGKSGKKGGKKGGISTVEFMKRVMHKICTGLSTGYEVKK